MRILLGAVAVLALAWGAPAAAVIIASGDGTGNTSAPADDPGFAHVAIKSGLSAVYIGDGWVLTANHVCSETDPDPCDIEIGGVTYREVDDSRSRLLTDGVDPSDLILFRIESERADKALYRSLGIRIGHIYRRLLLARAVKT